jgi:hypothetical protein
MQTDVGGEYPNWRELLEKICASLEKDVSPKSASNAEHQTRCIKSALTFRHLPP